MVFRVASPIPGFTSIKSMELSKIDDFFMRLQSKDDETSFTLINPYLLRDYSIKIPSFYREILDVKNNSSLLTLNVMIIATPIESSTINFIAPMIFNTDNKTMAQVLLEQERYPDYGIMETINNYLKESQDEA